MIINGIKFPCIGLIRAKPLAAQRWLLSIYPPADTGALVVIRAPDAEPIEASFVEIDVDSAEVERICCIAPHLIPGVAYHHHPALLGLRSGPGR